MGLTKKQALFINHYLTSFNATQAAKDAGYSPKSAHSQGWRLLRDAEVAAAIKIRFENSHMSAEEALAKAAELAREGNPRMIEIMLKHHGQLVERVEHTGESGGPIVIDLVWPDENDNGNDNITEAT